MIVEIIVFVVVFGYLLWFTDLLQQLLEQNIKLKNDVIEHNLKVVLLSKEDQETLKVIYKKMEEL